MASGDSLVLFTPLHNEPPTSNYATLDLVNLRPVLDFDAATSESAVFTGMIPQNYGASGYTAYIIWTSAYVGTGTPLGVRWDVSIESLTPGTDDVDVDSFDSINSVTDTKDTAGGVVHTCNVALTNNDSLAKGELFRLKITRDHDHADDDMTGDAELLAIEIRET